MVYPSHYITNFMGVQNHADHPYEIIKYQMDTALAREKVYFEKLQKLSLAVNNDLSSTTSESQSSLIANVVVLMAKFRPWLQDFNMGAMYNADMVKLEIKATQDSLGADYNGFMLWNPSNIYTQEAVLKP
jgi:hypothetical protein